jgi:hypothetical protein
VSYRSVRAIVTFAVTLLALGAQAQTLSVSFTPSTVVVSNDQPAVHRYVLLTVGRDTRRHMAILTREVLVETDTDGDGVVTFNPRRIPADSLWVVIDVESGVYKAASPGGVLPEALPIAGTAWQSGTATVNSGVAYLEALLVRPQAGAWVVRATDGGPRDGDAKQNAVVTARLAGMDRLIGEQNAPATAALKDVLLLVDPQSLRYFIKDVR